jgi:1-acyl-sn-glycerol-3-phosphate acyltransferase
VEPVEELSHNLKPGGASLAQPIFLPPSRRLKLRTRTQMVLGHIALFPLCGLIAFVMGWVVRYKIQNRDEIRKQFKEITKNNSPLIICSNHLTFIDSALLIWALGANSWYFFNYRFMSWNLPAGDVFKKKLYFRIILFLGKSIFIHRDGTKEHKEDVLSMAHDLIKKGQVFTIFPEGRRSRTGRFDTNHITFGTSKIIMSLGGCNILCTYIRSDKQQGYSNYPAIGSQFRPLLKLIKIEPTKTGRHGYAEVSEIISKEIKALEDQYFSTT